MCGISEIDKFEYGYTATLKTMAQMTLGQIKTNILNLDSIHGENVPNNLQQIYYGAPGTGKSHTINEITKVQPEDNVVRTTFHPDSDYSTFVGAYKPTTKEVAMRDVTGKIIIENSKEVTEDRIVYEFVEQAFLQAYTRAWKLYANAANDTEVQPQYLIIEEINRGNCAQIFGDLFQLLDRGDSGFSEYPIKADNDMKKQLAKSFSGITFPNPNSINQWFEGKDIAQKVLWRSASAAKKPIHLGDNEHQRPKPVPNRFGFQTPLGLEVCAHCQCPKELDN